MRLGETQPESTPGLLIVFDGECVLCCANAQFILRHDRRRRFRLTTAQGSIGQQVYRQLDLSTTNFETMVLIDGGRALTESDAAIGIANGLGGPWRIIGFARFVPKRVRDAAYRFVARNRFKLFPRRETCWRPTPDIADRIV